MTRTWFVTGATRGLGKEIALAALGAGENVVATGRGAEDVEKALAEADAGDRLLAVALDVSDDERPSEVVVAAIERFGRIDVLVRYAAGSDTVKMTRDVLEKRLAELDRWRDLSESTDGEEAVATEASLA